jgi:RNA polymerase sigma factor (sigma-70 family)
VKIFFIHLGNFYDLTVTIGMNNSYSNEQLLEGIKLNDYNILTFIYQYYYPMIEPIIMKRYGVDIDDAKDVFQDALIVIYEGVCSDSPLKINYSFFTFIATICKRNMFNKTRNKLKMVQYENEEKHPAIDDSEIFELIEKADRIRIYKKHFNDLGEKCRKLLTLVLKEVSIKEITSFFNFQSENFTKKRRNQCKESLFKKIYNDPQLKELINGKPWTIREIPRW